MTENLNPLSQLVSHITAHIESAVIDHDIKHDELTLISTREQIIALLQFLKRDEQCQFTQLLSVCAADYPNKPQRFEVVYHLLSMPLNQRVRIKIAVGEQEFVPTATTLFSTAGWFEREAWDLYGIYFEGHTDLRRILTDYGFEGHPLRKDFPLTGYVELRYDEEQRRVVYEPVKLTQDFRVFDNLSPWEGMTDVHQNNAVLPGDEKATEA